jgi:hypothetical protein
VFQPQQDLGVCDSQLTKVVRSVLCVFVRRFKSRNPFRIFESLLSTVQKQVVENSFFEIAASSRLHGSPHS